MLLPLQGALLQALLTQGDALGYALVAPSGRMTHNNSGNFLAYHLNTSLNITS